MSNATETPSTERSGERPDLGQMPRSVDGLVPSLTGTDVGSDTRAGSLRGGSASGSDIDPDQAAINEGLKRQGAAAAPVSESQPADADPVNNTGDDSGFTGPAADPAEGKRPGPGDSADAATG